MRLLRDIKEPALGLLALVVEDRFQTTFLLLGCHISKCIIVSATSLLTLDSASSSTASTIMSWSPVASRVSAAGEVVWDRNSTLGGWFSVVILFILFCLKRFSLNSTLD